MKCVIAGSRTIFDYKLFERVMKKYNFLDISEVVSGTAEGVDTLGEKWASKHGIKITRIKAEWTRLGKKAGVIRNKVMADYADIAIVIWDGSSPGSKNMIEEMKKLKKVCYVEQIDITTQDYEKQEKYLNFLNNHFKKGKSVG